MSRLGRGSRILLLILVGLVGMALASLYLTAPPPTSLTVRVESGESGDPLAGASVEVQPAGGGALPAATTDQSGAARFDNLPPDPAYRVQVRSVGHEFAVQDLVAVAEGDDVEITMSLAPSTGGRLYVGLNQAQIVEIDTASGLLVRTIQLPGAPHAPVRHLRAHPTEDLLYAVAGDKGLILDTTSGAVVGELAVETGVESLDLSADGRYVLATTVRGGLDTSGMLGRVYLLVLDARSGQMVTDTLLSEVRSSAGLAVAYPAGAVHTTAARPLPVSARPVPDLLWQPDGTDLIVWQAANKTVAAMTERSRLSLGVNSVPVGPRNVRETVVLSADEAYLYSFGRYYSAQTGFADYVELVATDDGTRLAEPYPAGVAALAASPVRLELYILNADLGNLTVLDLTGERAQTVVAVGKSPRAVTVSPDGVWVFVANRGSNSVSMVHAPSATVGRTISLSSEPISLAARWSSVECKP